jgi:hypothetical protein
MDLGLVVLVFFAQYMDVFAVEEKDLMHHQRVRVIPNSKLYKIVP